MTISPPPGFPQSQWPQADWILEGEPSIDPGLKFVTSWSTRIVKERSAGLLSLLLSPITAEGSQDCCNTRTGGTGSNKIDAPGAAQTTAESQL